MDFSVHKTCPLPAVVPGFKGEKRLGGDMEDAGIYARESPTLGRAVQVGIASGRVIDVSFPESVPGDAEADHPLLDRLFAYLDGEEEDDFDDVEVALTVPTKYRTVLERTRSIPYGRTVSASKLAELSGLDGDSRDDVARVEKALAANPTPVFVPDHRVRDVRGGTPGDVAETLRRLES